MPLDKIRYNRVGYIALNVSDVEKSAAFYETLVGLKRVPATKNGIVCFRCSDRHHDLVLYQSTVPGLKRIGLEMESLAALAAAREHLAEIGRPIVPVSDSECEMLGIHRAFRSDEPASKIVFEFYFGMVAAETAFRPTHTKIARLGHAVVHCADRPATENFLVEHMNFRVSDRIDNLTTFMRCFPNPYHHTLGIARGQETHLGHLNFMVTELADIGKANNRMKQNKVAVVFGPGKHPPSESVFLYFLDPDGLTVEYSFGMEEFPEENPRPPRDFPANMSSIDYWGGIPEMEFSKKGTAEVLEQTASDGFV